MPSIRNTLTATALAASTLFTPSLAAYSLADNYEASTFFSMFSFWTQADPTHGYVQYIDQADAQSSHLIQSNSGSVYMGVDMNNTASGSGRKSVRLTSKKTYDTGLFVIDLEHMPTGCGTWPAFWLVGPNWPNDGEIDIIEGVNTDSTNKATLHTNAGCSISSSVQMTGKIANANCDVSSGGDNAGCGITSPNTQSYGPGLNGIQGGVYATEVTDDQITVWFFPRSSIPQDIKSGSPNPTGWSTPQAVFKGCDVQSHFKDMQIVFDTTFCGDWAGAVWSSDSTCSSKASSCQAYVQNNPEGFSEAYWRVNSLKVYSGSASAGGQQSGSPSSGKATATATKKTGKATATQQKSHSKTKGVSIADVDPTGTPSNYPNTPAGTPYQGSTPTPSSAQSGDVGHPWSYAGYGGRGRPTGAPSKWGGDQGGWTREGSDHQRRHLAAHLNGQRAGHA